MSKFLRIENQIINAEEIIAVDWVRLPKDLISQKEKGYEVIVRVKGGITSTFWKMNREESVKLFNSISEQLEAVKV